MESCELRFEGFEITYMHIDILLLNFLYSNDGGVDIKLAISDANCNYRATCLDVCTQGAVNLAEGVIDEGLCIDCSECIENCPNGAIFESWW